MADLSSLYIKEIEILCPDLTVNVKYPAGDHIINSIDPIFRNTSTFVSQVKDFNSRYTLNTW